MGSTGNSSAPCNKDNESLAVQLVDFPFLQYAWELRPKWPYKTPHPHPNLANKRACVTEKSHLDTYTAGLTASKMLSPFVPANCRSSASSSARVIAWEILGGTPLNTTSFLVLQIVQVPKISTLLPPFKMPSLSLLISSYCLACYLMQHAASKFLWEPPNLILF